jgi:hypothetical protein
MTPKEKAMELYDKFIFPCWECDEFYKAKQCALIAVEEILSEYQSMSDLESVLVINNKPTFVVHQLVYWMEVKQEIELL